MKIFIAGGSGVMGQQLVPLLVKNGHEVAALTKSHYKIKDIEALGAKAIIANALDKEAILKAVKKIEPEIIIHQLTAIPSSLNLKKFDEAFAITNRLRTEATDTLIEAAHLVGSRRLIAQSFCGWTYAREGDWIKTEEDPLGPPPGPSFTKTLAAIQYLEEALSKTTKLETIVLRYGYFYGPGTWLAKNGAMVDSIRKRQMPVVGNGAGVWSFIHIQDAAQATVAAISNGKPGIYNIVDDEPAPVSLWLPFITNILGAKPPRKIPAWLAQIVIGKGGIAMMTENRGASNLKAKRHLGWQPLYPSWRQGFTQELS